MYYSSVHPSSICYIYTHLSIYLPYPSIHLPTTLYLVIYLFTNPCINHPFTIYLSSTHLSIYFPSSIHLSTISLLLSGHTLTIYPLTSYYPYIYLPIHLPKYPPIFLSVHPSSFFFPCNNPTYVCHSTMPSVMTRTVVTAKPHSLSQ